MFAMTDLSTLVFVRYSTRTSATCVEAIVLPTEINAGEITPEIEEQINEELNKMLLAAAEQAEKEGKNV